MRLCVNCVHYDDSSDITRCKKDYWIVSDVTKSKIFNPMMYECLEYEGINGQPNFGDDHLFDLFTNILK